MYTFELNIGATFLAISADYAHSGSGFVVPSACSKAGVEALTRYKLFTKMLP